MPISRKLNGCITGSDNILEMLSYEYNASISSIYNFILQNIRQLKNLRKKYKVDLIHKLILEVIIKQIHYKGFYNKPILVIK